MPAPYKIYQHPSKLYQPGRIRIPQIIFSMGCIADVWLRNRLSAIRAGLPGQARSAVALYPYPFSMFTDSSMSRNWRVSGRLYVGRGYFFMCVGTCFLYEKGQVNGWLALFGYSIAALYVHRRCQRHKRKKKACQANNTIKQCFHKVALRHFHLADRDKVWPRSEMSSIWIHSLPANSFLGTIKQVCSI